MSLTSQALRRLQAAKGSWRSIASATNVSYSWLCKFAEGRILNPSVQRIERILWYFEQMDTRSIRECIQKYRQLPITPSSPPSRPTGEEPPDE